MTTERYFEFLVLTEKDPEGANALRSLDIIDTKAIGIAGLIGGFSAAAFFMVQSISQNHIDSVFLNISISVSICSISISGILCASCLFIINHFQEFLFDGLDGVSEDQKIATAAKRILEVYRLRLYRYLGALYFLYIGIIFLFVSAIYYFLLF